MKIYSMTATFGKLENQTLTLEPGLNIISAPNEWGKSTWCAFLATMFYGLDTREKTTKTSLAVKERYAPWSGAPMSGRIDLNWNGRNITIERWTKGRTPMGEFRAYETESGLPVPELTGANCGETLLGVEKSVFLRAGFLRLSDLPVTADESLRRRLNALVTTGDESGAGDELGHKLKDLKNKCRSNRTNGLIPQTENQKQELESKLQELQSVQSQWQNFTRRQTEIRQQTVALENHRAMLDYQAAEENLRRVAEAEEAVRFAQRQVLVLEEKCKALPSLEDAQRKLHTLQDLQQKQQNARMDAQMLPQPPQEPKAPMCFYGLTGEKAVEQAHNDVADYHALAAPEKKAFPFWIPGALAAVAGVLLLVLKLWVPGVLLLMAGAGLMFAQSVLAHRWNQASLAVLAKQQTIAGRYGGGSPEDWLAEARLYANQRQEYEAALAQYAAQRQQAAETVARLDRDLEAAAEGMGISAATEHFTSVIRQHDALADARRDSQQAQKHAEALQSVTKPVAKPEQPDTLTCSEAETKKLLQDLEYEAGQLQLRLGQCQGRMDALGSESALQQQLHAVNARLEKLTKVYNALELALQTLQDATNQLQRRFAPRIADAVRELFGKLTGGRYDRLHLTQELSVDTAAMDEVAIRSAQWRSDGTVDQLYFALRLAVARELTPNAPLVLDDALVRFDDTRHGQAMEILRQEGENKQIILFTCQSREINA